MRGLVTQTSPLIFVRDLNTSFYGKETIQMYGYPGVVQVKDVVKDQEELLMKHIDDVEKIMEERKKEMDKLVAELESLFKDK